MFGEESLSELVVEDRGGVEEGREEAWVECDRGAEGEEWVQFQVGEDLLDLLGGEEEGGEGTDQEGEEEDGGDTEEVVQVEGGEGGVIE